MMTRWMALTAGSLILAGCGAMPFGRGQDGGMVSGPAEMSIGIADALETPPQDPTLETTVAPGPRLLRVVLGQRGRLRVNEYAEIVVEADGRTWPTAGHDVGVCWRDGEALARPAERAPTSMIDAIALSVNLEVVKACLATKGYAGAILSTPPHASNGPIDPSLAVASLVVPPAASSAPQEPRLLVVNEAAAIPAAPVRAPSLRGAEPVSAPLTADAAAADTPVDGVESPAGAATGARAAAAPLETAREAVQAPVEAPEVRPVATRAPAFPPLPSLEELIAQPVTGEREGRGIVVVAPH